MDALTFVNQMAERTAPIEKQLCALHWELATTGQAETAKKLAAVEKQFKLLFSNPDEFAQLKKWQQELRGRSPKGDRPLLTRQVDLLIDSYTPNQLDEKTISDLVERQTEIENIFNNFRAELDGKKLSDNDLKEILKAEKKSERRQAVWEASKQVGREVAEKVKELARRRNQAAQGLGFANHFAMSLKLQELDETWLFNLFGRLKQATQKTFAKKIEDLHKKLGKYFGIKPTAIMPWHYDDPFAQSAPDRTTVDLDPVLKNQDLVKIVRDFYQSIDLDVSDVLERSDLLERQGKCQHAFCITMDRGKDVRVLANIRPNSYWTSTMLHELGHAAYAKNIDLKLPYFLREAGHTFTTEAMAMLMERMLHHPHWLNVMCEVPDPELEKLRPKLWDSLALDKLITVRWVMVVTLFEKNLYENPEQDLNSLWWNLVKEFQLIGKPAGRDVPDWAAKIHIASYPCYYQNYLLGELFAAQIAQWLEKEALHKPSAEISFWNHPAVGKLLKEKLFQLGCQLPWGKLVAHATGQELTETSFVRQFCES